MADRVPRQRRAADRQEELLAAAARIAAARGPAACTARAIAAEAGLPLASVSYYFPDLTVAVAQAVRRVCDDWRRHAHDVAASAGTAAGSPRGLATTVAAAVLPPAGPTAEAPTPAAAPGNHPLPGRDAVVARCRHLLAAADSAVAATELSRLRTDLVEILGAVLLTAGRTDPGPLADLLLTVADGAALGAVAEGDPNPADRVVAAVSTALERLH